MTEIELLLRIAGSFGVLWWGIAIILLIFRMSNLARERKRHFEEMHRKYEIMRDRVEKELERIRNDRD